VVKQVEVGRAHSTFGFSTFGNVPDQFCFLWAMDIEEEYKFACLAEEIEGGYNRNKQNWVCSSSTNGINSPESPMMRPGFVLLELVHRSCDL
jgi:hypothetical protein